MTEFEKKESLFTKEEALSDEDFPYFGDSKKKEATLNFIFSKVAKNITDQVKIIESPIFTNPKSPSTITAN